MGGISLGLLALSADRAPVLVALAVLLAAAALLARRFGAGLSAWAGNAALTAFLAARVGHVIAHASIFAQEPLTALAFWQGGFSPAGGAAGFLAVTVLHLRRHRAQEGRHRLGLPVGDRASGASRRQPPALSEPGRAGAGPGRRPRRDRRRQLWHRRYAQANGGYEGIQIKVAEPDDRVQASIQAVQSALLYSKDNAAFGAALDAGIQELHASGKMGEILQANGLDPSGADVGEPRLVKEASPGSPAAASACSLRRMAVGFFASRTNYPVSPAPAHALRPGQALCR